MARALPVFSVTRVMHIPLQVRVNRLRLPPCAVPLPSVNPVVVF